MGLRLFIQWLLTSEGILLKPSTNKIHTSSSYSKPLAYFFSLIWVLTPITIHSILSVTSTSPLRYHFLKNPTLFIESILVEFQKILFRTSLYPICTINSQNFLTLQKHLKSLPCSRPSSPNSCDEIKLELNVFSKPPKAGLNNCAQSEQTFQHNHDNYIPLFNINSLILSEFNE